MITKNCFLKIKIIKIIFFNPKITKKNRKKNFNLKINYANYYYYKKN